MPKPLVMKRYTTHSWISLHANILSSTINAMVILTNSTTDQQLMLAYQIGDVAAFETLYNKHKDALYRFVLRHGLTTDNAEEIYQEIWSAVIKARLSYQPEAKFTTWIYQIARNKINDYYRKSKSQFTVVEESVDTLQSNDTNDGSHNKLSNNFRNVVVGCLASLPFVQRQTFIMYYEAALTIAEISEITEADEQAVKSRLRYAVAKLKTILGEDHAR
ncbi:MAG: sigma-70 family RNA polymerase sigma factor [Gammaproteobacteria bacterium]|nr:sigma-70 family RNA polymerase sigma factor [Gammaproteobacteria bacterium]NNJ72425.1 sigma-70 family RNA polymerase sigma factor [Enterobacterales bacterium]